jgi:hypothetical protein
LRERDRGLFGSSESPSLSKKKKKILFLAGALSLSLSLSLFHGFVEARKKDDRWI